MKTLILTLSFLIPSPLIPSLSRDEGRSARVSVRTISATCWAKSARAGARPLAPQRMTKGLGTSLAVEIQTLLVCMNSRIASWPFSRPMPLCL